MGSESKRRAKAQRREARKRTEKTRRQLANHCAQWMYDAEDAWFAKDFPRARRCFQRILHVRPTHQAANERMAELLFIDGLQAEGLRHFDRLVDPPEFPIIDFRAAAACLITERFDQGAALAQRFLRRTEDDDLMDDPRAKARLIQAECRRLGKTKRPLARQDDLLTRGDRRAAARRRDRPGPPIPRVSREPVSAAALPPSLVAAPAAIPEALPAPPILDLPPFPSLDVGDIAVEFTFDQSGFPDVCMHGDVAPAADVALRLRYAELRLQKGFDELLSLGAINNVEHLGYQLDTVRRVLRDLRGRVLLADEVGLGKTIEACLTLKEYWMRGLARKALILTPASLVGQWVDELTGRFALTPVAADAQRLRRDDEFWTREPLVVASLPLARQAGHRDRLSRIEYDLVIVDEAHALKNRASAGWQLVNDLKKRFLLLLSATPVGNNLTELYNLIQLLRPGLLQGEAQFRREYGQIEALSQAGRRDRLRELLREVMVRNTRAHIDLKLPKRLAATHIVRPAPEEVQVLDALAAVIRDRYNTATAADRWRMTLLQMQAGSGPAALRAGLRDHAGRTDSGPFAAVAAALAEIGGARSAKVEALLDLARRSPEKKIVFTRFRATLDELDVALSAAGRRVSVFHGGLSSLDKQRAIDAFQDDAEILLSTEIGGEGRNLQFCRTVINYDLPWNPATIEQRVGRVHRIGQTRDVYIFNLCLAGSVEERILSILHDKINMFELVAGEVEMILGHLGDEEDFASLVMDAWSNSRSDDDAQETFERLSARLLDAKSAYQNASDLDRALFSEDYEI
ncbi:MAG: DEAD/DEAH box helicase family protein [Cyanobacteria bacterium]|nr:DEAD/DEAH box helicase family protein [Cyanobacteriota bacterium]